MRPVTFLFAKYANAIDSEQISPAKSTSYTVLHKDLRSHSQFSFVFQINIPNEIVQYILDNISQGLISRGLFHEAALNIFSVLIFYWKRSIDTEWHINPLWLQTSLTPCVTKVLEYKGLKYPRIWFTVAARSI